MYAMQDYIGEDNFNKAMSAFIKANQFQRAPYANSVDYLDTLSHYTPDSLKYLITDMYKTITLYSNKCDSASWVKTADGKYKVTIHVTAEKFRADSAGKETAIPFADYIDIGVLGPETNGKYSDKQLFLKKFLVKPGKNTFEVIVGEEPVKAGIDIYNKLIDRDTDDNVKAVTKAG
jgi:ABC-2 type transport system permease protein